MPPLRRGERWVPGDARPRCTVLHRDGDHLDRCTSLAEPLHDLHTSHGERLELNDDDELELTVYGVAWITRAALPAAAPLRYPAERPAWLGTWQPWPCARCMTEQDASEPHRCPSRLCELHGVEHHPDQTEEDLTCG